MGTGTTAVAFGKYELLERIAAGGMGEVFLAQPIGAKPNTPPLVIKRILPHLAENSEFLELFLDEARIASQLDHPHIAQVYELGEVAGAWYLVMEFVNGPDLRRILQRAASARRPVPVGVACRIVADIASALAHAHSKTSPEGRPLNVIHRDVSPHNILVGFTGKTRLIDFGVARAANRLRDTRTGVLRGKCAYMSPEQALGRSIDARSDQFALGVVLWEVLCGQRLFKAESDLASLHLVANRPIPQPSELVPGLPEALDALALRMLSRDPARRFAGAGQAQALLEQLIAEERLAGSHADVAAYLRELFDEVIEVDGSRRGDSGARSLVRSLAGPPGGGAREPTGETVAERLKGAPAPPELALGDDDDTGLAGSARFLVFDSNVAPRQPGFFGRAGELAQLSRVLLCGQRLVTLVGPPGVGKSALAHEYAAQRVEQGQRQSGGPYPAGVFWVPLPPDAEDVESICAAVGGALGLEPLPAHPEAAALRVGLSLAARGAALYVLDGFDPARPRAIDTIGRWLSLATAARFLVTAQAPLRLAPEATVAIGPLDASPEGAAGLEALLEAGGHTGADLAAQVRALGGNPLAVRLALRGGVAPPAAKARAEPVAEAFAALPEADRATLARCALFVGRFTPLALEAVVGADAAPGAAALVEAVAPPRALLGSAWLELHDAVRAAARARAPRAVLVEAAAVLLSRASGAQAGPLASAATWLSLLSTQLQERGPASAQAALATLEQLEAAWGDSGPRGRLLAAFDEVLAVAEEAGVAPGPRLLAARAALRRAVGRVPEAMADLERASALCRDSGDLAQARRLGCALAQAQRARGRPREALATLERVVAEASAAADASAEAEATLEAAECLFELGRGDEARPRLERALALARQSGAAHAEAVGCLELGRREPDPARALQRLEAARPLCLRSGDRRLFARLQDELARVGAALGKATEARSTWERLAEQAGRGGLVAAEVRHRLELAWLEQAQGRHREALRQCLRAARRAEAAQESRLEAIARCRAAGLFARAGEIDAAARELEAASALCPRADRELGAWLELAGAERDLSAGAASGDAALKAAAQQARAKLEAGGWGAPDVRRQDSLLARAIAQAER